MNTSQMQNNNGAASSGSNNKKRSFDESNMSEKRARTESGISPYIRHVLQLARSARRVANHSEYTLSEHGVRIIANSRLSEAGPALVRSHMEALRNMPEMKPGWLDRGEQAHLGGASFLGQPSTFHSEAARSTRKLMLSEQITALLAEQLVQNETLVQAHIDRVAFRRGTNVGKKLSQKPSGESYHQDVSPKRREGATMYGSWFVLSGEHSQTFRCIPGTAFTPTDELRNEQRQWMEAHGKAKAFRDQHGFCQFELSDAEKEAVAKYTVSITIPPFAMIMFDERIFHEVASKLLRHDMLRQFAGIETNLPRSAQTDPEILQSCRNQTVVRIKSNQMPDMCSSNHVSFPKLKARLSEWSANCIADAFVEDHYYKSGPKKGLFSYKGVPRFVKKSLKDVPGAAQREYTEEELALVSVRKVSELLSN